jgi:Ran GTPase-activating protein (RanGAP) involved in mRNA processing and transport
MRFERLELSENLLGIEGALAYAELLLTSVHMRAIRLSQCGLNAACVVTLSRSIGETRSALTSLDLHDSSEMNEEGGRAVAEAMLSCAALTEVNLAHTNIGKDTASSLATVLLAASRITSMNLYENPNIGSAGAHALSMVLASRTSLLTHLDMCLCTCNVGERDARAITSALRKRPAHAETHCRLDQTHESSILDAVCALAIDDGTMRLHLMLDPCTSLPLS